MTLPLPCDMPVLGFFWAVAIAVVKMVAVTALSMGLSYLLARRNKSGMKPAGIEEFKYPTAQEGRPLLVVWGKRRVLSVNAITKPFGLSMKSKKRHGQTVAYYYYLWLHCQICTAADGVKQLWAGGKCLWPTANDTVTESADGETDILVNAFTIFGGYKREGGVLGVITVQYGGPGQSLDAQMAAKLGSELPAYRGFVGMIWKSLFVGTSPYLKPMSALMKRTDIMSDPARTEMWYIAKANIGDDHMNAVHVIYELLTSESIGAHKPAALIGASFTAAADTCYSEGFGLDIVWDSANDDVQAMIDGICEVIDGYLYQDRTTGLYEIALMRDDYNPAALEEFNESHFWIESYEVPSPGKVVSKTVVYFHDRGSTKTRTAYDDDIALIEVQGSNPVTQELHWEGFVADESLANYLAAREQRAASAMLKSYVLNCDRRMAHLQPGDVFKISYPALEIEAMIVRLIKPEYGSLKDGAVRLYVVEDIYGTAYTAYGTPPAEALGETGTTPMIDLDGYGDTSSGKATWDEGMIVHQGVTYHIAGNVTGTTDKYIYFQPSVSTTELQTSPTAPTGSDAYIVFENNGGVVTGGGYAMEEEDTIAQADYISDNWRFFEDADERLHLQHEDGGAWTDEAEFGEEVP